MISLSKGENKKYLKPLSRYSISPCYLLWAEHQKKNKFSPKKRSPKSTEWKDVMTKRCLSLVTSWGNGKSNLPSQNALRIIPATCFLMIFFLSIRTPSSGLVMFVCFILGVSQITNGFSGWKRGTQTHSRRMFWKSLTCDDDSSFNPHLPADKKT